MISFLDQYDLVVDCKHKKSVKYQASHALRREHTHDGGQVYSMFSFVALQMLEL